MILLPAGIIFLVLITIGVPLFFSLVVTSLFYFILEGGYPIPIIIQQIEAAAESFPMLALPFFVLAGEIIMVGGSGKRIVKFSDSLVRWLPGGLAVVTVGAAMIFAGMSGSLIADAAAIGAIMIPGMVNRGYHRNFASAVVASSGSIGVIIPPSIPFVLYGFMAGVSVGDLFIAGIIPGLLIGLSFMATCSVIAVKRKYPTEKPAALRDVVKDFFNTLPALGMLIIVLGGIFAGIFTATEAAAVAVVYGLLIGFFVHRELKLGDLPKIMIEATITSATVILVIGAVGAFTWGLSANSVPQNLTASVLGFTQNKFAVLLIINLVLLVLGCIMGLAPALLLTTPILLPMVTELGVDLLHFGMIIVANLAIGSFTPPVGGALYISSQIAGVTIWETAKGLVPFIVVNIFVLMLITYVPEISLFLPGLLRAGR
jgi:C4-dicarboxylate transporter DctM subunit